MQILQWDVYLGQGQWTTVVSPILVWGFWLLHAATFGWKYSCMSMFIKLAVKPEKRKVPYLDMTTEKIPFGTQTWQWKTLYNEGSDWKIT